MYVGTNRKEMYTVRPFAPFPSWDETTDERIEIVPLGAVRAMTEIDFGRPRARPLTNGLSISQKRWHGASLGTMTLQLPIVKYQP